MMQPKTFVIHTFLVVISILCLWSSTVHAHDVEYIVKEEKINLTVGTTLSISDPYQIPSGAVEGVDYVDQYKAIVELNYDRSDRTDIAGQAWFYEISYDLIDANTNTVIDNGTVLLSNDDEEGVYESLGIHEDVISDLKVKITAIQSGAGTVPDDLHLALKLQVKRHDFLDHSVGTTLALSSTVPNAKQQAEIYWQPMLGAEYYELEWVYWDEENTVAAASITDKEKFEQSIRVQTSDNHYTLDVVYPAGALYFRVRPVGYFISNDIDHPIEKRGLWSNVEELTISTSFEATQNWSFNRSYAEDGKHKQVIQYFDDGLKGRQGLTTLSSEDITIISESIYDVENRPTLGIMPVPVKNNSITGSNLQFGGGHSSGLITTGGVAYDRTQYDIHNTSSVVTSTALPSPHIASQYYSSNNSFSNHLHRDYTPDAEGYPVAQSLYDNDGRGYIRASSGVGAFYQLGSDRESKYFYASPTTTELKRFFGDNVGEGKYYRKNYAIDANGQISVSITDQAGQTILTALDGNIPENVQNLDGSTKVQTETLMGNNVVNAVDQTSTVSHTFMCTEDNAPFTFTYELTDAVNILQNDYGFCMGCTYELEIKIEGRRGQIIPILANDLTHGDPNVVLNPDGTISSTYQSSQNPCTGASYSQSGNIQFTVRPPKVGTYTIYKTLKATGPDADAILAQVQNMSTVLDQSTFIANYIAANFDPTECQPCNDDHRELLCEEIIKAEYPDLDLSDPTDLAFFENELADCLLNNPDCDLLRQNYALGQIIGGTECEAMLGQMKLQLSPGGCLYENNYYGTLIRNNELIPDIVLNTGLGTSTVVVLDNQTAVTTYLSDPSIWQDSWADVLVTVHPEYCRYLACIDPSTVASKQFDFELNNYDSWEEAATALNVTINNPITTTDKRAIVTAIITDDPYNYPTGTGNFGTSTEIDEVLSNYCTQRCSIANNIVPAPSPACSCSCTDVLCYLIDNAPSISSYEWELFKGIYINEKLRILYEQQCPIEKITVATYETMGCTLIAGPPTVTTTDGNGNDIDVNLVTDVNTLDDLNTLVQNNILGTGNNPNSFCNQLCTARADYWIQQMCPSLAADVNSGQATASVGTAYNSMRSQLINYCMSGCGVTTRVGAYSANPMGFLITEDLDESPFTDPGTGVIALLDQLQTDGYCGTGGGQTTLTSISSTHSTHYQLNITSNNVFANLPVGDPKCSMLEDIFSILDNDLFPSTYVTATGSTAPSYRLFNHPNAPTSLEGLPATEEYDASKTVTSSINTTVFPSGQVTSILLNNIHYYDANQDFTHYNRYITINGENLDDSNCATQVNIELEHTVTRQAINPMTIVSLGAYDCLSNTIEVTYATPDCYYSSNTQGQNVNNTACSSPTLVTATAFVKIGDEPCSPSWEFSEDSTWIPIVRTVTINKDSAIADCDSAQIAVLTQEAKEVYQNYLNSLVNQILEESSCMPVQETFTMSFESNEQHYTLYYYDAAGNLIHTLPPVAVNPLESAQATAGQQPAHDYDLLTSYTYNSLGQILTQASPDGGLSVFYYDYAQRLRLSQNARQTPIPNELPTYGTGGDYAYSKYDARGRVIEVGKLEDYVVNLEELNAFDFPNSTTYTLSEQTFTEYDEASGQGSLTQNYLRSRVARTYNEEVATYYDYDIHGNVKKIQHQIKQFGAAEIAYDYDLITGNVNQVAFQEGTADAYYHKYSYDADNRLTHVLTSDDGCLWHQEARYFYYAHGPLARVELGADKVQGLDYYYNLQGWIKGVNNTTAATDPGRDGDISGSTFNTNQWIGKDEQAFYLGYHREDYKPIGGSILGAFEHTSTNIFDNDLLPAAGTSSTTGLFNGNIAFMITHLPALEAHTTDQKATNAMVYQYDALHRIKQARSYHLASGSTWTKDASNERHDTEFSYDANGNIETLKRYHKGSLIDNLIYHQLTGTKQNQLAYIEDAGTGAPTVGDLATQTTTNYAYDAIGNLIQDESQDIENITWDLSNKIEKVSYTTASGKSPLEYTYDALGQRLTKTKTVNGERISTIYIRDASGNVMGMYEMKNQEGESSYNKRLEEVALYGASRLGVKHYSNNWITYAELTTTPKNMTESLVIENLTEAQGDRGHKVFELSNHLGNVLATVSDKKLGQLLGGSIVASYYEAQVQSASDYYPFGWQIPGRKVTNGENYRYSFNGVEQDQEWHGGQSMAFEFRTYDPRVGKFLSIDPLAATAPYQSGYLFAANNPVLNIDYLGLVEKPKQGGKGKGRGARKGGGFWNKLFRRKVKQVLLKEADMQEVVVTAKRPTKGELRRIARRRKRKEREAMLAHMKSQQKDWVVEEYKPNNWAKMRDGNIGNQILYGTANAFYAGSQVWFTPHVVNLDNTMSLTPDERLGTAANFVLEVAPIGKAYTLAKPGIRVATSSGVRKAVVSQAVKKVGCFVEGTIVITADSSVAIDSIQLGQLVAVSLAHLEDPLGFNLLASIELLEEIRTTPIIAGEWKELKLELLKANGDKTLIELLRSTSWVEENLKVVDSTIYISLPEMGSIGDARVLSIHSSTIELPDSLGSYRPVTGKFIHISNMVWELTFEGMEEPLGVTSNHPIWSNERQRWVEAGELEIGEEVKTQFGATKLLSKKYLQGGHRVYNIEVHDTHNYFVSSEKILVHNTCWPWPWKRAATIRDLTRGGGKCKECAEKIQKAIGGDIIHIVDGYGAPGIGDVYNKMGELITDPKYTEPWTEHYAVRKGEMIFDRITGEAGMHIDEYKKLFKYADFLIFNNVVK